MDLSSLVNEIKTNHIGEEVLVVGHSNTVPQTINQPGINPALADIPHNEYDNLYIVTLCKCLLPALSKWNMAKTLPDSYNVISFPHN